MAQISIASEDECSDGEEVDAKKGEECKVAEAKLAKQRHLMAFGSLEAEANSTQNATESFQNRIVPIVPIDVELPRLVGHHILQQEKVQTVRDGSR